MQGSFDETYILCTCNWWQKWLLVWFSPSYKKNVAVSLLLTLALEHFQIHSNSKIRQKILELLTLVFTWWKLGTASSKNITGLCIPLFACVEVGQIESTRQLMIFITRVKYLCLIYKYTASGNVLCVTLTRMVGICFQVKILALHKYIAVSVLSGLSVAGSDEVPCQLNKPARDWFEMNGF